MKAKTTGIKVALISTAIALAIAAINLIYSYFNKLNIWSAVTIFCATIALFFANIASYQSQKKNSAN